MHHYQKNIGDYAKKAARLSILQHGVYNLLMDCCYDRENFPTREEAIDWVWASSSDEIEAVDFVLRKFFTLQDDGTYVQKRIHEELEIYREKCVKQAERGRKGGRPKKTQRVNSESQENPPGLFKNPEKAAGVEKKPYPVTSNQYPVKTSCSEPPASDQTKPPDDPHVASLPTNRHGTVGEVYSVTQSEVDEYQMLYPAVDVSQQLNAMRGWLNSNPTKRKTLGGMSKFVNGWLAREQNRSSGASASPQDPRRPSL